MQDHVEGKNTSASAGIDKKRPNVFVLGTGRCGSATFIRACSHMVNYTSGHETLSRELGEQRFAYPPRHIEADNRLSWFLGGLHARFGDDAVYVHLKRDAEQVAESYHRRWTFYGSILMAFGRGVLKSRSGELGVAQDYVRTVTDNITHFLADKTRVHYVDIDDPLTAFKAFWRDIGAEGDLDQALAEFAKRHNSSAPSAHDAEEPEAEWAQTVIEQLEASRDRFQARVRVLEQRNDELKQANASLRKEGIASECRPKTAYGQNDHSTAKSKTMRVYGLIRRKVRRAVGNAKPKRRHQPTRRP